MYHEIFAGSYFLRILQIDLDPQKLVPAEKNTRKIKRRKNNKTPFSQIKNFALNRLMPLDLNMIFHWKKQTGAVKSEANSVH